MAVLPTGTVTFLFTDIEGSTTLLRRLGDRRYAEILAAHRRLLRDAFTEGNGQEIDTQGDAFLVAFPRARDAVAAAVAAQQALMKHSWPEGTSLRVRMGLHTGEPLSSGTSYVGMDVHRAARICSAGHGGQILLSHAVEVLVAPDLPSGTSLRDLGLHRLKDLQRPEHLFQVVHPDLLGDFPPLKSLAARSNNLPLQLTSFVGREREITAVKESLSTTRLVTLTGIGGSGKTRLALQVAAEVLEHYPDGVWLAQLAALSEPTLVPKAVASALEIPEQPGRPLTETVVDYLRPKALLLLLDNCEHLLEACASLANALLQACPNLRIVATSREALGIAGELTYRVPSLSLPDLKHLPSPEALMQYEAVRLFVERAAMSRPEFKVIQSNMVAVAEVTRRLDGIPLAIELAAARVKSLPVDVIAARLDDQFRLLTGGSRTALPRHQTLRATLDWSHALLSERERVLLRRLAVFAGGFSLEAAEKICAGQGLDESDILDLLTHLVDKSLVGYNDQNGQGRYRLLETVRQYGRDKLQESGEGDRVRRRHRDWYLAMAEQSALEVHGARQQVWVERLETEFDNLRAALEWSKREKDGAEAGLRLAGALRHFWLIHGHWGEARKWLEGAIARSDEAPPSAVPRALAGATMFAWRRGDLGLATTLADNGLALCRKLGDKIGTSIFLRHLGQVAMSQGDYHRATALLEESLNLSNALGIKWNSGVVLSHLGEAARYQGDYDKAEELHAESLTLFREIGDKFLIAYALHHLGIVLLRRSDYRQAAASLAESLILCREVGDKFVCEECLEGLAQVTAAEGCYEQAAHLFGAAEALRVLLDYRGNPHHQSFHAEFVASTRVALKDAVFAAAWAEGRAMTLEQAIEYALVQASVGTGNSRDTRTTSLI